MYCYLLIFTIFVQLLYHQYTNQTYSTQKHGGNNTLVFSYRQPSCKDTLNVEVVLKITEFSSDFLVFFPININLCMLC